MEEERPSLVSMSNPQYVYSEAIEARFVKLCKTGLALDENLFEQAMRLLKESKNLLLADMSTIETGSPEEIERFWFAIIIYSVRRLSEENGSQESDQSEIILCQIMKATNLNLVDFIREMPQFLLKAGPVLGHLYGADWKKRLEATELQTNFLSKKDYNDAIYKKCELDERVFVNDEDSLLGAGSLSGGATNVSGAKRKFDAMASPAKTITSPPSPPQSPTALPAKGSLIGANSIMAPTPVSRAMTTEKWLRTVISPLPSKPSAELEHFLSSCDRDLTNDVTHRAHIILEAIFPRNAPGERCITVSLQSANLMVSIWAEQRRMEALKLYYRVLEAFCQAESQVLRVSNLTPLLTNERFHRCVLACSAELVLATHKLALLFPMVLERTGITAFDLSKVIESFIRYEESLPRELMRHLNCLEEKLLESMVWAKGSSLYNSLIVAMPNLSAEISSQRLLAEPMPSLNEIAMHNNIVIRSLPPLPSLHKREMPGQNGDIRSPKIVCGEYRSALVERNSFTSPVKDLLLGYNSLKSKLPPPLQSGFASPTRKTPGGGGETCAEIFFSKIQKLAAVRINGLVERLKQTQQIRETIYCFFKKILRQQTSVFFNRHIDQIILASIYGVANISQLNLTFEEIVENYGKQKTGQDFVGLITFYYDVFIPTVKHLLEELYPSGTTLKSNLLPETNRNSDDGPCPGSPRVSSFPSLPDMSPKKVSPTHNVYVSPLPSSKMDALNSNSSRSYYACVGESTHAYQSPTKDLTAINNHLNGSPSKKINSRLNFDNVIFVSDSLVTSSLYFQNGNCPSSSGVAAGLSTPLKVEQRES